MRFGGLVEGCKVVVVPDSGHRLLPEYQNGVWGKILGRYFSLAEKGM